jgi:hypothetical protein
MSQLIQEIIYYFRLFSTNYPQVYDTIFLVVSIVVLYKLIRFTISTILGIVKTLLKWIVVLYTFYIIYAVVSNIDLNSNGNSNPLEIDQVVIVATKTLYKELSRIFQGVRTLVLGFSFLLVQQPQQDFLERFYNF